MKSANVLSLPDVFFHVMFCPMSYLRCLLLLAAVAALTLQPAAAQESDRSDDVSFSQLESLAKQGNADAQFELGARYFRGDQGAEKDVSKAVEWINKAAAQQHLPAMTAAGEFCRDGVGTAKDDKKAFEWFRKAAQYGYPRAQQYVSECYDMGVGIEKDETESLKWLLQAAHQDYAPSQAIYAWKLENGVGVPRNTRESAVWYLRSAQNGLVKGMTHLAYMYYIGKGVPLDYRRAEAWYRRAAKSEDPWARNDLAWFLSVCPDNTYHDGEAAVEYARSSLEKIDPKDYQVMDTLAAALARNGKYGEAVQTQLKAMVMFDADKSKLQEPEDRAKLQKELAERLSTYKKQVPFTEAEPKEESGVKPLIEDRILQEEPIYRRRKPKPEQRKDEEDDGSGKPVVISALGISPMANCVKLG